MRENRKRGRKPLAIVLSVLVLLLAVIGVLSAMVLNDPNEPLAGNTDASAASAKIAIAAAAATGKPAQLTGEEAGAMLSQKLAQGRQSAVRGVRLTIKSDNTVAAYLPVVYKGIKLGVSANLTVGWDGTKNEIRAAVNSMKIGRLPVNPAQMLPRVKEKLPQGVEEQGGVLYIAPQMFGSYEMPNDAPGNISGLEVRDGKFFLSFSVDMSKLKEYLEEQLKSLL